MQQPNPAQAMRNMVDSKEEGVQCRTSKAAQEVGRNDLLQIQL